MQAPGYCCRLESQLLPCALHAWLQCTSPLRTHTWHLLPASQPSLFRGAEGVFHAVHGLGQLPDRLHSGQVVQAGTVQEVRQE